MGLYVTQLFQITSIYRSNYQSIYKEKSSCKQHNVLLMKWKDCKPNSVSGTRTDTDTDRHWTECETPTQTSDSETVADWVTVSDPRLVNPVTGWVINWLLCTIVYMVVGFFGMFSHRCTQSLWQWVNDTITHAAFSIWFPDVAQISQTIDNAGHFITMQYALVNW